MKNTKWCLNLLTRLKKQDLSSSDKKREVNAKILLSNSQTETINIDNYFIIFQVINNILEMGKNHKNVINQFKN